MEQPVIYISKEDLASFCSCNVPSHEGVSYEWEGEQVVHIRFTQALHSYGKTDNVLFAKPDYGLTNRDKEKCRFIVKVFNKDEAIVYENNSGKFIEMINEFIPSKSELYSRNKGILEVNILENKRVMIVGLGSFGSQIAIELAKAGVGQFALFDFDRVELHNLARHTSTVNDLGRLKTDVIYDAIKGKNPYAIIEKFPININDDISLLNEEIAKSDLVICATDNNSSRFNVSEALEKKQKIGIFGRAVTRAEGGDVFRYIPGGPCYCCLIGTGWYDATAEEITNVEQLPGYTSPEDAEAIVQVGLSSDIEPICNMMVKLAIVELSKGQQSGISVLEDELIYNYYLWANRRERRHANWAPMPNAGNKPTILRWYGAHIKKVDNCPLCSHNIMLDDGEEYEKKVGKIAGLEDVDLNKL